MVGLSQVAHRHVGEFSKGMMRRIGLAQALINDPEFLILDEPTSGLDPIGTRQVKDLLIELKRRGKTILLSSHLLSDVEDVCDRMTILYGGKIHAEGTADELLVDSNHTIIKVPRIKNDGTIQQIEKILETNENSAIETVTQPRQNLEAFFIQIVDKARENKIATSGANAGNTAAFLRGDEEGDVLIDKLIDSQDAEQLATQEKDEVIDTTSQDDAVLDSLLNTTSEPTLSQEKTNTSSTSETEADASVIEGLLSNEDEEQTK